MTVAVVDRPVHRATIFEMNVESSSGGQQSIMVGNDVQLGVDQDWHVDPQRGDAIGSASRVEFGFGIPCSTRASKLSITQSSSSGPIRATRSGTSAADRCLTMKVRGKCRSLRLRHLGCSCWGFWRA